jgi:hypothetical protein
VKTVAFSGEKEELPENAEKLYLYIPEEFFLHVAENDIFLRKTPKRGGGA